MRNAYHIITLAFALSALGRCNIEVGNPDSEVPEPARVQSLSFMLAPAAPCHATPGTCVSVPVVSGDPQQDPVSFEMKTADFQLASAELKPYATQSFARQLRLLQGSVVGLPQAINVQLVTEMSFNFAPDANAGQTSFILEGNMVALTNGGRMILPLTLSLPDAIVADTLVASDGNAIDGIVFDANVWFDFSDSKQVVSHILKSMTSGACIDADSVPCTKHRENLSKLIGKKIAKSLVVTKKSAKKTK